MPMLFRPLLNSSPPHDARRLLAGNIHALMMPFLVLTFSLTLPTSAFEIRAQDSHDWPQFRGPGGQGHASVDRLPTEFHEKQHLRWKASVPGYGWSSPVGDEREIWLTTSELLDPVSYTVELKAICFETQTGQLQRSVSLLKLPQIEKIHPHNTYASPTAVLDAERVYCHFGTFGTFAIERATGAVVWANTALKIEHQGGPGSSPVSYGDLLIVACDGADYQYVAALHKRDGSLAWKTNRSAPLRDNPITHRSFSTPLLISGEHGEQLISCGADQAHAYHPATGEELWHVRYLGFSNVPSPVYDGRSVYLCTVFFEPELLAIDPTGRGNITSTHIRWRYSRGVSTLPSPILAADQLFLLNEGGILVCLDTATGKVLRKRRLSGNFSASPLLAGNALYFSGEDGRVSVIRPNDTLELLHVNRLDGMIKASPAVLHNSLLIRTEKSLYCFEL